MASSRYRLIVLRTLYENPSTPSQIAEANEIDIAHVSRALSELRDRDEDELVTLLVDEETSKGRIYRATETGEETWNRITDASIHKKILD